MESLREPVGARLLGHREPTGHDHTRAAGSPVMPGGALSAPADEANLLPLRSAACGRSPSYRSCLGHEACSYGLGRLFLRAAAPLACHLPGRAVEGGSLEQGAGPVSSVNRLRPRGVPPRCREPPVSPGVRWTETRQRSTMRTLTVHLISSCGGRCAYSARYERGRGMASPEGALWGWNIPWHHGPLRCQHGLRAGWPGKTGAGRPSRQSALPLRRAR